MPKKGQLGEKFMSKTYKIDSFPKVKTELGTVDKYAMKSIYLSIKGDMECCIDDVSRATIRFDKKVKYAAEKLLNKELFDENFICYIERADKFKSSLKGYVLIEFTFFLKPGVTSKEFVPEMEKISNSVYNEISNFEEIKYYTNEKRNRKPKLAKKVVREKKKRGRKKILQ